MFSIQIGFEPLPKTTDRPECLFGKVRGAWEHSAFSSLSPRISLNQKGKVKTGEEKQGNPGKEVDRMGMNLTDKVDEITHTRGNLGKFCVSASR